MPAVIAITCDRRDRGPASTSQRIRPARPEIFISEHLVAAVQQCGALPILIAPDQHVGNVVDWVVEHVDGVIISGGSFDISPHHYGEQQVGRLDRIEEDRTALELALARRCIRDSVPLLGICGGMQVMAVAGGGTLIQDIGRQIPNALQHEQPSDPAKTWHHVEICSARLQKIYKTERIHVNSTHHQAVRADGDFVIAGYADDGIIEAIEWPELAFCLGVQWHPELLGINLIRALIASVEASE